MNLGSSMRRRRGRRTDRDGDAAVDVGRWGRIFAITLALVLGGFGAGYLFATQVLFPAPEAVGELVVVPDVRNMDRGAAARTIVDSGLVVTHFDSAFHPSVPAGVVFGQNPLAGQSLLPGGEMRLTLSLGAEVRTVPQLVNLAVDRALTVLEATGFTVQIDSVESEEPAGRVLESLPEPGTELAIPGDVTLLVSLGPPPISMPELVGMTEYDARELLDSLGLVVSDVTERYFPEAAGQVIEQQPLPDSLIERGSAVRLFIGRSPGGEDPGGLVDAPDAALRLEVPIPTRRLIP